MIAASQAIADTPTAKTAHMNDSRAIKTAGLAFIAIVSALFWMAVAALAGPLLGFAVTAKSLLSIGSAVALFLTLVCAPILLRN